LGLSVGRRGVEGTSVERVAEKKKASHKIAGIQLGSRNFGESFGLKNAAEKKAVLSAV